MIDIALKRMCKCGTLIDYGQRMCKECEEKYKIEKREKNKQYDKNVRKNKEVYHNKSWTRLTEQCKRKFKGLDIYSYYVLGKIEYGSLSHHIETIEDCENRRFDLSNLIYVSKYTHDSIIHPAYNKSDKDKKEMQELLFSLIEKWKEEYGG